jgi:hypothetical protein
MEGMIAFQIDSNKAQLLQLLCTSDYEADRRRNPERESGTCEWIPQHQQYQVWEKEPTSAIIWLSGDPGCGKSVAASFLIDHIRTLSPATNTVYFFFKDDSERQSGASSALCAILHQIFSCQEQQALIAHAIPEYSNRGQNLVHQFDALWSIFTNVLADPSCKNTCLILDAMDECREDQRDHLINNLTKYCHPENTRAPSSHLKVIMTSRPLASVQRSFKGFQVIRLKAEDSVDAIDEDVKAVIDARVDRFANNLNITGDERLEKLRASLLRKADHTFIWVSLVLDILERSDDCSFEELHDIIEQPNPSVNALYDKILGRVKNVDKARKLLCIVVGAAEPLTLTQVNIAWATRVGERFTPQELENRMLPNPERGIKEACGLFVRVIADRVVLVHQTAREFLLRQDNGDKESPNTPRKSIWRASISIADSSQLLAGICLTHLLFTTCYIPATYGQPISDEGSYLTPDFAKLHITSKWDLPIKDSLELYINNSPNKFDLFIEEHEFIDHAANHWLHYERSAKETGQEISGSLRKLVLDLFVNEEAYKSWLAIWKHPGRASARVVLVPPLFIATNLNLTYVVTDLLQLNYPIETKDHNGYTALCWAVMLQHHSVLDVLLKAGANANAGNIHARALHTAVRRDDAYMTEKLIHHGANVLVRDLTESIPLQYAKSRKVAEILLQFSQDEQISGLDWRKNTPLLRSVLDRNDEVAELLIQKGANVNVSNIHHDSPLACAKLRKAHTLMDMLIEAGAQVLSPKITKPVDELS